MISAMTLDRDRALIPPNSPDLVLIPLDEAVPLRSVPSPKTWHSQKGLPLAAVSQTLESNPIRGTSASEDIMASKLFSPIHLAGLEVPNRIVVAPMCQYSAQNGTPNDWHLMHLGQFAVSGTGLILIEASGVEPEGRITPGCTGIYSDENEEGMARVIHFVRNYGHAKIGIQLGHAGRKASSKLPWQGGTALGPEDGAWQTVAPSPIPYAPGWHTPEALNDNSLARVKQAFVQATERCIRLDFDCIEIHSAHGYLLHQFLSPITNQRTDQYGGSLENRMRFPLELFDAIRAIWPDSKPLGVRFSAQDWIEGGWDLEECTTYAQALEKHGCNFFDVSSGGAAPQQNIISAPGYQTAFAATIKCATNTPVMAVGRITQAHQAETILQSEQADMIALARGMLYDPRWAWHAAAELGDEATFAPQYARSHPSMQGQPVPGNPPAPKPA
jgi:2,4-dienoyl-CoA reductase-like NADH-dependent reductase (Old Yellow Enzyme family)